MFRAFRCLICSRGLSFTRRSQIPTCVLGTAPCALFLPANAALSPQPALGPVALGSLCLWSLQTAGGFWKAVLQVAAGKPSAPLPAPVLGPVSKNTVLTVFLPSSSSSLPTSTQQGCSMPVCWHLGQVPQDRDEQGAGSAHRVLDCGRKWT